METNTSELYNLVIKIHVRRMITVKRKCTIRLLTEVNNGNVPDQTSFSDVKRWMIGRRLFTRILVKAILNKSISLNSNNDEGIKYDNRLEDSLGEGETCRLELVEDEVLHNRDLKQNVLVKDMTKHTDWKIYLMEKKYISNHMDIAQIGNQQIL